MLLIPAIDLKEGKCVRLKQGRMDDDTIFSEHPAAMAERWISAGAERLHIVDLDGARSGKPQNLNVIREIVEVCGEVPVQLGGGIRSEEIVQMYLDIGVRYVIIGTKAVSEPHFVNDLCLSFPGHVIIGLDARDGKVAIDGWSKLSHHDVIDMAQHFENDGVESIIYTNISHDGMLEGIDIDSTVKLAQAVRIPIIASGGVAGLNDIKALLDCEEEGISGVIIGRALYEGKLDFEAAIKLVKKSN